MAFMAFAREPFIMTTVQVRFLTTKTIPRSCIIVSKEESKHVISESWEIVSLLLVDQEINGVLNSRHRMASLDRNLASAEA